MKASSPYFDVPEEVSVNKQLSVLQKPFNSTSYDPQYNSVRCH